MLEAGRCCHLWGLMQGQSWGWVSLRAPVEARWVAWGCQGWETAILHEAAMVSASPGAHVQKSRTLWVRCGRFFSVAIVTSVSGIVRTCMCMSEQADTVLYDPGVHSERGCLAGLVESWP